MLRNRLKNIINKSKESSVGDSFDLFKSSLPKKIQIGEDYRLEAAWKAYGSPKDFKSAIWEGLIQPIDENTYKLPSIGYNEETNEYEYLNKGRENETVDKDIRVWDNDVIPLVKELKQGGYIRVYNEEKDCWTYSKQPELKVEEINSFKKGGKTRKYKTFEELKTYLGDRGSEEDYDLKGAYNDDEEYFRWEDEESKNPGNGHWSDKYKLPNHPTFSIDSKYSNKITQGGTWKNNNGQVIFETSPWIESQWPLEKLRSYFLQYEPNIMLVYKGLPYLESNNDTLVFKQGGQMNVIAEGALHARKNNMEGAGENFTSKGIPVMTSDGKELVAEIEKEELIFNKETTEKLELLYKKFNSEELSLSEKDEIAIKAGKLLSKLIIENTQDNTGLILEVANE